MPVPALGALSSQSHKIADSTQQRQRHVVTLAHKEPYSCAEQQHKDEVM